MSQFDTLQGIIHSGIGITDFFIGVIHFCISSDDLLARQVEAVAIAVNLVEGLAEGAVKDRMLLGRDFYEVVQAVTVELNDHKGAGSN